MSQGPINRPAVAKPLDDGRVGASAANPILTTAHEIAGPDEEWDAFVKSAPNGDIVQSSAWGLSKRALGQTVQLIQARDGQGAIVGGALLISRRIMPGVRLAYVARGPVVLSNNRDALGAVIRAIVHQARYRRWRGLIVQPPIGVEGGDGILEQYRFVASPVAVAPEATIRIDVTQPDESILGAMSAKRRWAVRKSLEQSIDIVASEDVVTFHRLHAATGARKRFAALSLEYLRAQWSALAPVGGVVILLARHAGTAIAGVLLSRFGNIVTWRLSGWDATAGRIKHVNEALQWAAIQWTRTCGARIYDLGGFDRAAAERLLEGSPPPNGFEKTHAFFKVGFNRTPVLYPKAQLLPVGVTAELLTKLIVSRLPESSLRRLAQRLRVS